MLNAKKNIEGNYDRVQHAGIIGEIMRAPDNSIGQGDEVGWVRKGARFYRPGRREGFCP